nr:molybdopterin-dependent oxidoreductase [Ktedonobacteraceae bacterium]
MQNTERSSNSSNPATSQPVRYSTRRTLLFSAVFALGAGLLASLLAIVAMLTLRLLAGIPTPVELFGDFYLKHIDVHVFITLLNRFNPNSKTAPLGLALLGMLGVGTVLGLVYAAILRLRLPVVGYRPSRREQLVAAGFAGAMTLVAVVLFWDELRQNLFGFSILWATVITIVGLLVEFCVYGAALCLAYRALLPKQPAPNLASSVQERRQLLSRAGVAALTVGGAAGTLGLVRAYFDTYTAYDGMETPNHQSVTSPITPNDEYYVVTQNALDPKPDPNLWQLEVTGLVNKPGVYNYANLQKLPSTSRAVTIECISNGIGGHLMSTAVWQGVTLNTLLEQHGGAQSTASYIAFHSVDDYTTSLPLKEVLEADPILAWRMNGVVLPQRHGFPLRVIMPGRYGEESPKWLTRVELTDHFVGGLYADQGWYNGEIRMTSRIDRPGGRISAGRTVEVGGIAYAGIHGVQKVEVSTDSGRTWQQANLQPALSKDSWVLWTWPWKPAGPGKYTLVVRTTNGQGQLQSGTFLRTVPT